MSDELTNEIVNAKWAEIAPLIDVMSRRIQTPGEFPVQPGSVLARDDVASSPYQISHTARWCLNAGVDHLHALKSLVVDGCLIHSNATYSLIRGALENLAAGFWVLHPAQRSVRIEHGLRWWIKNFRDQYAAIESLGIDREHLQRKVDRVERVGRAAGCDLKELRSRYFSTPVVKYAEEYSSANKPLLMWSLCSGFAHGRPWASFGVNEQEVTPGPGDGVSEVRFTTDRKRLLGAVSPAFSLMEDLTRLIQDRSAG